MLNKTAHYIISKQPFGNVQNKNCCPHLSDTQVKVWAIITVILFGHICSGWNLERIAGIGSCITRQVFYKTTTPCSLHLEKLRRSPADTLWRHFLILFVIVCCSVLCYCRPAPNFYSNPVIFHSVSAPELWSVLHSWAQPFWHILLAWLQHLAFCGFPAEASCEAAPSIESYSLNKEGRMAGRMRGSFGVGGTLRTRSSFGNTYLTYLKSHGGEYCASIPQK